MNSGLAQHLSEVISEAAGEAFRCRDSERTGGGCINQTVILRDGERAWFVKLNRADRLPMFEAEARGLQQLGSVGAVRVPAPLAHGRHGDRAYLVLEHIPMARLNATAAATLGECLARLHSHRDRRFGWDIDNNIGSTPQRNGWTQDWVEFWQTRRLGAMAEFLAGTLPAGDRRALDRLIERVPVFFDGYRPEPSLLHGDLWGGNAAATSNDEPVIYDPAVYFGDREADLAMTELFGGFDPAFAQAYCSTWPTDAGYPVRRDLYNLYHVLNHALLFGGGYRNQAAAMIARLLAAAR